MSRAFAGCVVDASTAIKIFVPEVLSEEAIRLFGMRQGNPPLQIYVPDLFFAECGNILWKCVRRFRMSADEAAAHYEDLLAMNLFRVPTPVLARNALSLATTRGLTVYDALYVAASSRLDVPLITADERMLAVMKNTDYDVRWLKDAVPAA